MSQIHEVSLCKQSEPEEPLDLVEACQLTQHGIYLQDVPNAPLECIEYFHPDCSELNMTSIPDLEYDKQSLSQSLEDADLLKED